MNRVTVAARPASSRAHRHYRGDHLLVAEMVEPRLARARCRLRRRRPAAAA